MFEQKMTTDTTITHQLKIDNYQGLLWQRIEVTTYSFRSWWDVFGCFIKFEHSQKVLNSKVLEKPFGNPWSSKDNALDDLSKQAQEMNLEY